VEKQIGSEAVRKLNQLRTNFEPAPVLNQFFFGGKGVTDLGSEPPCVNYKHYYYKMGHKTN